jgi:trans-2,3-dihydro-3-hydroxyanthranilate isomerase
MMDAPRARWHARWADLEIRMKIFPYRLLDVFTNVPFGGNPMAVFTDSSGLSDVMMQSIARELNLSETSFVLPPRTNTHHYFVRAFTPLAELTTGGLPSIGTAYALALEERLRQESARQRVVFEELTGPISVTMEAPMLSMQQALPTYGPLFKEREAIAAMLGLEPSAIPTGMPVQSVSCGVPYLLVPVANLAAMESIRFRLDIWERVLSASPNPHVYAFTLQARYEGSSAHCRMFAPGLGVHEDAATATAAGPLAAYFSRWGLLGPDARVTFVCEQGIEMGRPSFIHVTAERAMDEITSLRVGGQCVAVGQGEIQLEI